MSARRDGTGSSSSDGTHDPAEPERRTLDRVASGDLDALALVYKKYAPRVYRTAYRITRSKPDAQDVVQDIFIALPEALLTFRGEGSFVRWLRSCAARQALLHLRERRRRQEVDLLPDRLDGVRATDLELDRIELNAALQQLPDILRVVVILRDVEGFSHDDVAGMLNITHAASRMRLMRARQQLRDCIDPPAPELGGPPC